MSTIRLEPFDAIPNSLAIRKGSIASGVRLNFVRAGDSILIEAVVSDGGITRQDSFEVPAKLLFEQLARLV